MSNAAISRMIERNMQRDTLGLGYWREPKELVHGTILPHRHDGS
jgi:hypothetical protein